MRVGVGPPAGTGGGVSGGGGAGPAGARPHAAAGARPPALAAAGAEGARNACGGAHRGGRRAGGAAAAAAAAPLCPRALRAAGRAPQPLGPAAPREPAPREARQGQGSRPISRQNVCGSLRWGGGTAVVRWGGMTRNASSVVCSLHNATGARQRAAEAARAADSALPPVRSPAVTRIARPCDSAPPRGRGGRAMARFTLFRPGRPASAPERGLGLRQSRPTAR